MSNFNAFLSELDNRSIKYISEYELSHASTFKIGGKAAVAVIPENQDDLIFAIDKGLEYTKKLHVLGRGSNTLFSDDGYDGILILTKGLCSIADKGEGILECSAGASLGAVSAFAVDRSLSGFEFASGIPGSIGGAMFMNAGAYGSAMSDVVVDSLAYDLEKKKTVTISEHEFGYRKSIYSRNKRFVCLSVRIKLNKGNSEEIKEKIRALAAERRSKQPIEYPSGGSYFKRPEGYFAGKLIEDCGLKGVSVGGAEVSEKHAGFIINKGGATSRDVLKLEEQIRKAVYDRFYVLLEREVEYVE